MQLLLINEINDKEPLKDALQRMHLQVIEMQKFSYIPLSKVQSLAEGQEGENIFNTFVFKYLTFIKHVL